MKTVVRAWPKPHFAIFMIGLAIIFLASAGAFAKEKGAMEIGLAAHYDLAQGDALEFDPGTSYGVIFHYWLNSTSTIMLGFEQFAFQAPLEVDGSDKDMDYNISALEVGWRHRPKVDLFVKPYFEVGFGYHNWYLQSPVEDREGSSVLYFLGLGLEYEIRHQLTISANTRYYYMAMNENIETEAISIGPGIYDDIDDAPLKDVRFLGTGIELTWKIK